MDCVVGAGEISINQTLELLDTTFQTFAEGVANDNYMFWIGSGISIGRVDGLPQIVSRIVEFLRSKVDHSNPNCRYRKALVEALSLAAIDLDDHPEIKLSDPFEEWPLERRIKKSLVNNYARLLDIEVDGERDDYLLWDGIDIQSTFADPEISPDVAHLCLAILVEEKSATHIASANWDGLIERASREINQGVSAISICIRQEDLRQRTLKSTLYKFHGCAPSAVENEERYRPCLVGRLSQIHNWANRDENSVFVSTLENLVATKPTLVLGFSAQDSNIQSLFSKASNKMNWEWPGERPSYVFSENELGIDQRIMLKNVYKDQYQDGLKTEIREKSRIKAYAEPLLLALVLDVLCSKIRYLAALRASKYSEEDRISLAAGIIAFRDTIASHANDQRLLVVRRLTEISGAIIGLFRDGASGSSPRRYEPVIAAPLDQIGLHPGLSASGLQEAALAIALLGHGVKNDIWTVTPCEPDENKNFVLQVKSTAGTSNLQLISNNEVAIRLISSESVEDADESIAIFSTDIAAASVRSPHSRPGRTGRGLKREVSIKRILDESNSFEDLLQQFREQVAL